jgi:AbrB family looped-hinge helix DNA binding protein
VQTTRVSSKGQVVLPKSVRAALEWNPGQELTIERREDGILLRPRQHEAKLTAAEVAGILKYDGPPVSLEDMERAIEEELQERWRRKSR